jgi:hypothetical protein
MSNHARPTLMTALFFVPAQWAATKRLAKIRHTSAAAIVRQALDEFLQREVGNRSFSLEKSHGIRNPQTVESR